MGEVTYDVEKNKALVLRRDIREQLLNIHPRVLYGDAPPDTQYPFVLFRLGSSSALDRLDMIDLEIDLWDDQSSTIDLEILTDKVDKALNRFTGGNKHVFYTIYRESRLSIHEPEKRLKRRQLVFNIRVMGVND